MRFPALSARSAVAVLAAVLVVPSAARAQQVPFEQVVARLQSADAGERLSAVRLLAEAGYPEGAVPVAPLLADADSRVQREALAAEMKFFLGGPAPKSALSFLGRRSDPLTAAGAFDRNWGAMPASRVPFEVVTGLLTPLDDRRPATRLEAIYALGVLGQIEGVPPDPGYKNVLQALVKRMGDAERDVRVAAARATGRLLRRCPDRCEALTLDPVGDGLIRLLSDPELMVQGAAMEALGEMRYERAARALAGVFDYYKQGVMAFGALDTMARVGSAASAPIFKRELASKDPNFRRASVEGLARIGGDAVADVESIAAAERDPSVLLALSFARHRAGRVQGVGDLLKALDTRDLRAPAQDYLVELGPAVSGDLAGALPAATVEGRVAILDVLGVTGGTKEAPAIERMQNDRDQNVAAAARRALARIRSLGR
jgi:HEAT repeat protein